MGMPPFGFAVSPASGETCQGVWAFMSFRAALSFRTKRGIQASQAMVGGSDSSLRCAPFRMTEFLRFVQDDTASARR